MTTINDETVKEIVRDVARTMGVDPGDVPLSTWRNSSGAPVRFEVYVERASVARDALTGVSRRSFYPVRLELAIDHGCTLALPNALDAAIRVVQCSDPQCKSGGFCRKGHPGLVIGGAAPTLELVGGPDVRVSPTIIYSARAAASAHTPPAARVAGGPRHLVED